MSAPVAVLQELLTIELQRVSRGATLYRERIARAQQDLADGKLDDATTRELLTSLLEVARQELGVPDDALWVPGNAELAKRRLVHHRAQINSEGEWRARVAALQAAAEFVGVIEQLREVQPALWGE